MGAKKPIANKYCLPRPIFVFIQQPFSTSISPNGVYKDKAKAKARLSISPNGVYRAKARLNAMYSTTQRRQASLSQGRPSLVPRPRPPYGGKGSGDI